MSDQQKFHFERVGVVNINPQRRSEPEQSKDDIWKFRLEPRWAARLQQLVNAKRIDRSRFVRDCIELGEVYHDHKDVLLDHSDIIIEICKRIDKKF